MYSILNVSKFIGPFRLTIFKYLVLSICFSLNFSVIKIAVKGVAKILHLSCGHKCAIAPIWSSCAWVKIGPYNNFPTPRTRTRSRMRSSLGKKKI